MHINSLQVLFAESHPVKLGIDLQCSSDGNLSPDICALGIKTLTHLATTARKLGAGHDELLPGCATAVFRNALNGPSFLRELEAATGVTLQVVSQEEEARLGFQTALAAVETQAASQADSEVVTVPSDHVDRAVNQHSAMAVELPATEDGHLVVWDSGGGSFQIVRGPAVLGDASAMPDASYLGPFASANALRMCVEDVQGGRFDDTASPNPVSVDHSTRLIEVLQRALPSPQPVWIRAAPAAVAIGSTNSIFYLATDILGVTTFTAAMVKDAIGRVVGHTDEALQAAWCRHPRSDPSSLVVPKLCLLYAVMMGLRIQKVMYVPSVGCWYVCFWKHVSMCTYTVHTPAVGSRLCRTFVSCQACLSDTIK